MACTVPLVSRAGEADNQTGSEIVRLLLARFWIARLVVLATDLALLVTLPTGHLLTASEGVQQMAGLSSGSGLRRRQGGSDADQATWFSSHPPIADRQTPSFLSLCRLQRLVNIRWRLADRSNGPFHAIWSTDI